MSKKKMPRAVMTLKDFHGGSIPSDLPLPSAPGMTVDRSTYERQGSGAWSSPTLGRGYGGNDRGIGHFRQGSGNGVRTFDDKASFFPNPANIGRNYEEDERKPVDGRPRSDPTDHYEDHSYEEQRARPGYEQTVDRFSLDEQGGYAPRSRSDSFGRAAESGNYGGQGDSQVYRQPAAAAYATEPVALVSRSQSSYMQASQLNMQQRARPASPPGTWRQQTQQPTAASVTRNSGPNVWPARQEENTRMVEPAKIESRSASAWRAPTSRPDVVPVEKAAQGRWQSESMRADRQGPGHVGEVEPVRGPVFSEPNMRRPVAGLSPPRYASDQPQGGPDGGRVGYGAHAGQVNYPESGRPGYGDSGRDGYTETGRSSFSDSGRRGFVDGYADAGGRGPYEELSRGGYVDDGGRRRVDDERSLGYNEPLRSGNSERITFSDSGRSMYPEGGWYAGEPNRSVDYPENGRREYRDSGSAEYVDAGRQRESVDSGRGGYVVGGRGNQEHGGRGSYNDRVRPVYGGDRGSYAENPQANGPSGNSGRTAYNMEGVRDSYGPVSTRGSYPAESAPPSSYSHDGGYGGDSNVAPFGEYQDRSRSPFGVEKSFMSNGSRSPPPVESNRGGYSSSDSAPNDPSRGVAPAARTEPVSERPRLKLLPRTKPLESAPVAAEVAAAEETVKEFVPGAEEKRPAEVLTLDGSLTDGNDGGDNTTANTETNEDISRPAERPKLNLKPRSQPAEPGADLDGSGNVRQTVFGGARPRELVLKERGVDDPAPVEADVAPTRPATIPSKPEQQEGGRTEVSKAWGDEKQEASRLYEARGARSIEKQGPGFPERQDGNRVDSLRGDFERKDSRRNDRGGFERQDSKDRYENNRSQDRQENRNRDGDRQEAPRRDIDKQESWRRPASPPPAAPAPPPPTLLDPGNRQNSGKFGYTAPTSAVELAQAFSRSSSLGSPIVGVTRTNSSNQRGPMSPGIRGPGGYGVAGYNAGATMGGYGSKDAPFSRLAEAPPPVAPMYTSGGGYGNDRANNGFDSGNKGYGSNEANWAPSYGRSDDDFPGKRGLPLRRPYD